MCKKKIETVTLAGLNNYVLNSPPQVRSLSSFYSYMFDSLKSSRQPVDPTEQAPQADADVSPSDETSAPKKVLLPKKTHCI
ncbi:hypothetical protein Bca52824_063105 [Brassica carinata]|uniref:Uncharacterized protein n=1 Tax=Brassica carinata TaxID=52824 RepID=A0A8X7QE49_BRACI|nr:hypothetical protein Bca52824_063105 [Brassica carinata]